MKFSILTVSEQLYEPFIKTSLIGRAINNGLLTINICSYFSLVQPKERIDAPVFGHSAGMLIRPDVIERGITSAEEKHGKALKIFFSPQGKQLTQPLLREIRDRMTTVDHAILVTARYEGIDARVEEEYADYSISIGDFVLLGGDLPAMMFMEGLVRLLPGVVGKQESVAAESFSGPFFDYPSYAPPVVWHDKEVPEVLRSGNHKAQLEFLRDKAIEKTVAQRFDWIQASELSKQDRIDVNKHIPPHYVVLMHSEVNIGPEEVPGTTSVTTIDIHDIARSSATYGIKKYFLVTPLLDQQRVVRRLIDFWQGPEGTGYNESRQRALSIAELATTLDHVIDAITTQEHGQKPLLVATSARLGSSVIGYTDQGQVWASKRPVLLIFGTGRGLTESLMRRVDFVLRPIHGLPPFNHLSVRSAVAIVLDRWLGINPRHR